MERSFPLLLMFSGLMLPFQLVQALPGRACPWLLGLTARQVPSSPVHLVATELYSTTFKSPLLWHFRALQWLHPTMLVLVYLSCPTETPFLILGSQRRLTRMMLLLL